MAIGSFNELRGWRVWVHHERNTILPIHSAVKYALTLGRLDQ
jgi:hypothetical protein